MLSDRDTEWLVQQIMGTAELLGQQLTPTAAAMLAEDLSAYPRPVLAAALSRVRTEHAGKLTPKVILDRIDEAMGRPAANEAWATALAALDERNTVVWTGEMAQAWAVAQPLAAGGDQIGARMAFKEAYERLVRTAREERRTPVVTVSVGWDAEGRAAAVEKAVKLGYMPHSEAVAYLPAPAPAFSVTALLAGRVEVSSIAPPELRGRLLAMKGEFAAAKVRRAEEKAKRVADAATDLAQRKAQAQNMTEERLAQEQGVQA